MYNNLFSPAKIGGLVVKNRIIMPAMATGYASINGEVTERLLNYYRVRAAGGAGLTIVEASVIDNPAGRDGYGGICIDHPRFVPGLNRLSDIIRSYNCRAFIQLFHAGRQTKSELTEGRGPVAPSPIACRVLKEIPRELTSAEIKDIIVKFVKSAEYAYEAGFDGVEIHAAHGYLINQFLSAQTNLRTDQYGGSLENRVRMLLEICRQIKSRMPELALGVRLNIDDFTPLGLKMAEAEIIAIMLEESGVDVINCSAGIYESGLNSIEPASYQDGWRIYLAEKIKSRVAIPVIAGGMVRKPAMAEQIIAENKADFVFIGRSFLADSQWANKARFGKQQEIRPCIICNNCIASHFKGQGLSCTVNAAAGRETFLNLKPHNDLHHRHAVVVGGGPAGLQTAISLSKYGMKVTLFEKNALLGGMLNWASLPPYKGRIAELKEYLVRQLYAGGAEIMTGKTFTLEDYRRINPDYLIIAAGSEAIKPNLPGWDDEFCFLPGDIFSRKKEIRNCRIVIIGGGNTGAELADFLIQYGNQVIMVEEKGIMADNMERKNRRVLLERLQNGQVILMTGSKVERIESGQAIIDDGREIKKISADYIVAAIGFKPDDKLYRELPAKIRPLAFVIGDAFRPAGIREAILQAEMLADGIVRQITAGYNRDKENGQ